MAIEVIRQGKLPEEKPYRGRCYNCGTEIKCLKADTVYQPDGPCGQHGYRVVTCPLCLKHMAVREA